jgi:hypothetical protein
VQLHIVTASTVDEVTGKTLDIVGDEIVDTVNGKKDRLVMVKMADIINGRLALGSGRCVLQQPAMGPARGSTLPPRSQVSNWEMCTGHWWWNRGQGQRGIWRLPSQCLQLCRSQEAQS